MRDIVNKYPVGIQLFVSIREGNYLCVDKTKYIAKNVSVINLRCICKTNCIS